MNRSIITALALALVVETWLLTLYVPGLDSAKAARDSANTPVEAGLIKVRVRQSVARLTMTELVLTGRTEPSRQATLSAETKGRVIAVEAAKGARVTEGDIIVRIESGDREARLAEAKALLRQRQIEYEAARKLSIKGYQSQTRLAQSLAYLRAATARLRQIELDVERTTIRAPFSGVLQDRVVEVGDYLGIGDPLAVIVDLQPVVAIAQVTEREVAGVRLGQPGKVRLVTGDVVDGVVRYVSSVGEDGTRTFRVELEIPNEGGRLAAGLTAELRLPIAEVRAHVVSPALLTLTDDGTIGVKSVDSGGIVRFNPISIVAETPEGLWIAGLPNELTIITVGQEFVLDGQPADPVPEETGAAARTVQAGGDS